MKSVAVVGLGYVGLSLARRASSVGFSVYGIDINKLLLGQLASEAACFVDLGTELRANNDLDVIIICVPTPVTTDKRPNLKYINDALVAAGKVLRKDQLIIIESTVFPNYCEEIGRDILERESGLIAGVDFYFAHCPERVNPGDSKWSVANIPRVIGGIDDRSTELAMRFYSRITSGELHPVSNIAEAEASKMIENTFRDINIAFVNEMARSFDGTNVNIHSVLRASATKPFGYMSFTPGMGVGGHCIPVDPYYLMASGGARNFTHPLLRVARKTNDAMVNYVYGKIVAHISEAGLQNPRIGLFGLTYKPNVPDIRESQSMRLLKLLLSDGLEVKSYDPLVDSDVASEDDLFKWANIVVTAVNHDVFIDFEKKINSARNIDLVIDTANMVDAERLRNATYKGIGL